MRPMADAPLFKACLVFAALGACEPSGSDDRALAANEVSEAGADDAEAYALQKLNAYRAMVGAPPLAADAAASAFARTASQHREVGEAAHIYCEQSSASCACGLRAENQGMATRFPSDDTHMS